MSLHHHLSFANICRDLLLLSTAALQLPAQCTNQWAPTAGVPGLDGEVFASTTWDPDGLGPAPSMLVVAGNFTFAGNAAANRVAALDPVTGWTPLGLGLNSAAYALAVLPNGDLVVGGQFSTAGGSAANRVARWNGVTWSAFGAGPSATVNSLAVLANGSLVAGTSRVEVWNGTTWAGLGGAFTSPAFGPLVFCLRVTASGQLVAGGDFTSAGGVIANRVAAWNGVSWTALGSGLAGPAYCLAETTSGELVVGGNFASAGGVAASMIAKWTGQAWGAFGSGMSGAVLGLAHYNGSLIACGSFASAGGTNAERVARWDGQAWSALGQGIVSSPSECRTMTAAGGSLYCGGSFSAVSMGPFSAGLGVSNLARWDGVSWSVVGSGFGSAYSTTGTILAATIGTNGDLVVGGRFTNVGNLTAFNIARWDGAAWHALGQGFQAGEVRALATLPNGDIVAGGLFGNGEIARWDGTTWHPLGIGMDQSVDALAVLPNGDLIAGGNFIYAGGTIVWKIARWNGSAWSDMGGGLSGPAYCLAVEANGDLLAGGSFLNAGAVAANRVARWNGSSWSAIGSGLSYPVRAISALPNGDIVVGTSTGRVQKWNGSAWSMLGSVFNNAVYSTALLPNGDILVGGLFTMAGATAASQLARWNGTTWSSVAAGVSGGGVGGAAVRSLVSRGDGRVVVGGDFTIAGTAPSPYLATLTTTCPATATPTGAGCAGTGGPNVLTATTLPWIGSTFHTRATGMPALAFVVAVTGFSTTSLPLAALLPQGGPGCSLLAAPDVIDLLLPVGGVATAQLALPNAPALVGQSFHQQMLPLEVDPLLSITAFTSTNAVTATIGAF